LSLLRWGVRAKTCLPLRRCVYLAALPLWQLDDIPIFASLSVTSRNRRAVLVVVSIVTLPLMTTVALLKADLLSVRPFSTACPRCSRALLRVVAERYILPTCRPSAGGKEDPYRR
jgi:hypothetical protein